MMRILLCAIFSVQFVSGADVSLAPLFCDHAVLQRDRPVPVWGSADPGTPVTVRFAKQSKHTLSSEQGVWRVWLDPLPASATPQTLTANALTVVDVLVGDVWLCSGQSNMEWALARSAGGPEAVEHAENPLLRLCLVPHNSQRAPVSTVAAVWTYPSPRSVRTYSAIAYWFGDKLQRELGVPIGIINNSYGGTTIEGWMPSESLAQGPWPQDKRTDQALAFADYEKRKETMLPAMAAYESAKTTARAQGQPAPPFPAGWPGDFRGPSTLWNGMVVPLVPYGLRGVLWYQGESNAYVGIAHTYHQLLPALIRDWRQAFAQDNLPFIVFQLARNRDPQHDVNEPSGIAEVQEAQLMATRAMPFTTLVVTTDLGEKDVHYATKEPAAKRAVQVALQLVYGRTAAVGGPTMDRFSCDGGRAIIKFIQTTGGLRAADNTVDGFLIAGDDRVFHAADARIDGDTVIVESPAVRHPVAVRYSWGDFPPVTLFNGAGWPAGPFRTDTWPLATSARKP